MVKGHTQTNSRSEGRWQTLGRGKRSIRSIRPSTSSSASTIRILVELRMSNGLHLSQKNLNYQDLVRMVEKLFIYDFISKANVLNVPFIDFFEYPDFINKNEYIQNSLFLNRKGAKAYTSALIKKIYSGSWHQ